MIVDTDKLRTIANYAKEHGKTAQWAQHQVKIKKVKVILISGKQFIKVK